MVGDEEGRLPHGDGLNDGPPNDEAPSSRADGLAEEPEDADLTGSRRSLQRRLLGLNVTETGHESRHEAEQPQGSSADRAADPDVKENLSGENSPAKNSAVKNSHAQNSRAQNSHAGDVVESKA